MRDTDRTVRHLHLEDAAEIDSLGYSAIWMAGGQIDRLGRIADLVRA